MSSLQSGLRQQPSTRQRTRQWQSLTMNCLPFFLWSWLTPFFLTTSSQQTMVKLKINSIKLNMTGFHHGTTKLDKLCRGRAETTDVTLRWWAQRSSALSAAFKEGLRVLSIKEGEEEAASHLKNYFLKLERFSGTRNISMGMWEGCLTWKDQYLEEFNVSSESWADVGQQKAGDVGQEISR